ncbi:fungal fruit body lectin [Lactarius psammicola]|nr:fungal fruit body lectin [Lactarius psammicola]
MSYSINVFISQTNPGKDGYFRIVEQTVWTHANGGTWDEVDGYHVLKMGGSETSGSLRLVSNTGGSFVVTLGVHNHKRWGDIVTNLGNDETACVINPQYYGPARQSQKEKQLTAYEVTDIQGRKYSLEYVVADGNDLTVRVAISQEMSYSIKVLIYQTNPSKNGYFRVVEKTVWKYANGGTWNGVDGYHVLKMGGSGTSGSLRLLSNTGESFVVTLGIHNHKRWGDIVTNLGNDETACVINPQYYMNDCIYRQSQRERQLAAYEVADLQGCKYSLEYIVAEGNDLTVRVVIA